MDPCHTPHFDPVVLDVYDVYIVNDHGVELKAKAPPLIGHAMFWDLKLSPMVYRGMRHILCWSSCKYASIIKMNTTSYGRGN